MLLNSFFSDARPPASRADRGSMGRRQAKPRDPCEKALKREYERLFFNDSPRGPVPPKGETGTGTKKVKGHDRGGCDKIPLI